MRFTGCAIALWAVVSATAGAQQAVQQPDSVAPAEFRYGNYYDGQLSQPSPSDTYVAPTFESAQNATQVGCCEPSCGAFDGCGDGCGDACGGCGDSCCILGDCCLGDPWSLKDCLLGPCCWLDMGGWTQIGYHDEPTRLSSVYGDGFAFNDVPNQVNLHQQWLWFEKAANAPCCGWDWGFRFDVMYGTDAQKTQAFGNEDGTWDATFDNGVYGFAMPQAYLEVARGDWSVIAGHFFTLVGYETVTAPDNFFYSHAYTMFNSEPFTHTGVLATYSGSDIAEFYMGYTLGWDTGFDQYTLGGTSGSNWIGGFSTDLTDDVTMTYISTYGDFGARSDFATYNGGVNPANINDSSAYSHSLVFDVTLSDTLNYVIQSDLVDVGGVGHEQVGINQYLFYKSSDCLSYGTRMEWWKNDGLSACGLTGGINYRPHANLVLRPEIRYNWAPGEQAADAALGTNGFNQTVFGIDAILTY